MKGEAKVVEFLNKALRHELTAVNQYWCTTGCSTIGVKQGYGQAVA